ncbi:MAG: septum site-determining protein MinC [Deltaproteobacteria bacterium]|nr:septum site-determining protein MinC [Deltaproteobacteria bacterium]
MSDLEPGLRSRHSSPPPSDSEKSAQDAGRKSAASRGPFQLKGTSFKVMSLRVFDPSDARFFERLAETIRQAPAFFSNAPIVLDLTELPELPEDGLPLDLAGFVSQLRGLGLAPVGVEAITSDLEASTAAVGLPFFRGSRPADHAGLPAAAPEAQPAERGLRPPLVITEPVRSGRQVYAAQSDLIVLAPVGAGAEILADGHIHVYDTLRGRALAGLNGDRSARIFCRRLEAELVSIAGLYKVSEDIDLSFQKTSVQIYLDADRLCVGRLS